MASVIGISDNPPGIVLMLAGAFAIIVGAAFRFGKVGRTPGRQLLYWAPRSICLVCAGFISIFAFDVFQEGRGFLSTALALLAHLTPTIVILLLLAVSWRYREMLRSRG